MMFLTHILSGILFLKIASIIFPIIPFNLYAILFTVLLQILPDVDMLWAKNLSSHHDSYFHAPIFWIWSGVILFFVSLFVKSIPLWISYVFILQTLSHLLFDYITARTAGVAIFYPFDKKEYSLYSLNKKQGEFKSSSIKAQLNFLKYYSKNKFLLWLEILFGIAGLIILLFYFI